jgi:hypothetical protein
MNGFEENVSILTESDFYNPTIPNTIGQGLFLSNLSGLEGKDLDDYSFHWTTNYGYFITWLADEKRSVYLSNDTVIAGNKSLGKIFWAYPIEDIGKIKPNVSIQLEIQNNSCIYQNSQTVSMTWSNIDVAQVSEHPSPSSSQIFRLQKQNCSILLMTGIAEKNIPNMTIVGKDAENVTAIVTENTPYKELNSFLQFINKANGRNYTTQFYDPNKDNNTLSEGYLVDNPEIANLSTLKFWR